MKVRMTDAQLRAITTLDTDLAVVAGAGSGKTSVLAHRFAHALTAGVCDAPTAVDRLLTITFTTKAAAEIAERVRSVVRSEGSAEQASRIEDAWISTIHGFCSRLVRRHVLEAGIEPFFAVADEVATHTLKAEAFEAAAAAVLEECPQLATVVDALALSELRARVIGCHDKVKTLGLEPSTLVVPIEASELGPLVEAVIDRAAELKDVLECASETVSLRHKKTRLDEWTGALSTCSLGDGRCEEILDVCGDYDVSHLPSAAKDAQTALRGAITRVVQCARAVQHRDSIEAIAELARRYAREYAELKSARGVLDFDDLQQAAAALLEGDPLIAKRYREHFELLMIDEFQDTNALQMRVLAPLRQNNLCIVGDERQSIYGFRYADVEIFRSEAARMSDVVPLAANFRSHRDVLGFVNGLFSQEHLFGSGFLQLEAKRTESAPSPAFAGAPRVECVFVDDAAKRPAARGAEAAHIAERVRGLLDAGVAASDVCILLRNAGNAAVYATALEAVGTPSLVTAGASLFDEPEVGEVVALLRAIAVPDDDEALLSVLSGRVVALPDHLLLAIARASETGSLWTGLGRLAAGAQSDPPLNPEEREALEWVSSTLERLWSEQRRYGLAEFARRACHAFDYDVTLHVLGISGVRAWGNVVKVFRLAAAFERAESTDLAEFVEHLRRRELVAPDKPASAAGSEGAVRIMTIHAAKGLEFPVVFVADLVAAQRHSVSTVLVEADNSSGFAVPVAGVRLPENPYGFATTPTHMRLAQIQSEREVEEEKRCLYVACTRARELLVVSGACSLSDPAEEGPGLIDWVRQGLGTPVGGVTYLGSAEVAVTTLAPEAEEPCETKPEPMGPVADDPLVGSGVRADSGWADRALDVPSSVSYSALRLHERCPLSFHAQYRLHLRTLEDPVRSAPLEFGSAVHRALQWAMRGTLDEVRVEAIVRAHRLSGDERARVVSLVKEFEQSEIRRALRAAERVAVEEPLLVPLDDSVLVGAIDAIAWSGRSALIVDYKTGASPEPGADREQSYRLQAECYALGALKAGAAQVRVVFAFVEHEDRTVEFDFDTDDAEPILVRLNQILAKMRQAPPAHLKHYEPGLCGSCPAYGSICPVRGPGRADPA